MKNLIPVRILRFLLCFVLFVSVSSFSLFGQLKEFSVESVSDDPFDGSGRSSQYGRVDGDGYNYAILKVTTDDPSDDLYSYRFNFGALYSEIVVHPNEGEIWVYVQRGAKSVTIERSGYRTISRYDLQRTFESGNVYRMALKVSQESKISQRQYLQFQIEPAIAEVDVFYKSEREGAVEFKMETDITGSCAKLLELGSYTYRIYADYYHTAVGRVVLDSPNQNYIEKVTLRPNFAEMTLNTSSGSDIYIDGEKRGTTSWSGRLSPGEYLIECRKANHKSVKTQLSVKAGENRVVKLDSPIPIVGSLAVVSTPLGASITVDGKSYGQTPTVIENLLIGSHTLSISRSEYQTISKTITIKEGQTLEETVTLMAVAPTSKRSTSAGVSGTINGHEYVDLGLPSGLKWATCNVGADSPEEYGDYYAWGETSTKSEYTQENSLTYGESMSDILGNSTYDVARKKWGSSWRLPTRSEFEELRKKCKWIWTTQNGVWGYEVTGPNGNSIFLPAAGHSGGSSLYGAGGTGSYWSSRSYDSSRPYDTDSAYSLCFYRGYINTDWSRRSYGRSVRPVSE